VQPVPSTHPVRAPQVVQGDDRPIQFRRDTQHHVRSHWRQSDLQEVDIASTAAKAAGGHADDDVAPLALAADLVHEYRIAEIEDHRQRRIRDHLQLDSALGSTVESGHPDAG
jgi:hypothetical protein